MGDLWSAAVAAGPPAIPVLRKIAALLDSYCFHTVTTIETVRLASGVSAAFPTCPPRIIPLKESFSGRRGSQNTKDKHFPSLYLKAFLTPTSSV